MNLYERRAKLYYNRKLRSLERKRNKIEMERSNYWASSYERLERNKPELDRIDKKASLTRVDIRYYTRLQRQLQLPHQKAMISNPVYSKHSALAVRYDRTPSQVEKDVVIHGVLGGVFAALFIASMFLGFIGVIFGLASLAVAGFNGYRYKQKHEFLDHRTQRYCITKADFESQFLQNQYERLTEIVEIYENNIATVDEDMRYEVSIDRQLLDKRLWEVASHLLKIGVFYDGARQIRERKGDVLEKALHSIRGEIDKLEEAVQNLTDVAILSTANVIEQDYVDPTVADTLQLITRGRLSAQKQLMSGNDDDEDSVNAEGVIEL